MKVILLTDVTENQLKRTLMTAIRTCYSENSPIDIYNGQTKDVENYMTHDSAKWDKLLFGIIMRSGHYSVLEHINFTFAVEGISRSCLAQLTRHRHPSHSVQSQRYVKYRDMPAFVMPDGLTEPQDKFMRSCLEAAFNHYETLLEMGVKAEDARAVLPNAMPVSEVITMNLRTLLETYKTRTTNHAQKEIRELFHELKRSVSHLPTVKAILEYQQE